MAKYTIPFRGLKDGRHEFHFTIAQEFFENFQTRDICQGEANVKVLLDKAALVMKLRLEVDGKVNVACDRCLDRFDAKIKGENILYLKFGDEHEELAEDVIVLSRSENEIRLAHYIFELFTLCLPLNFVHPADEDGNSTCNEKMIQKLNDLSVNDDEKIDPRWNDLKKLKDNN